MNSLDKPIEQGRPDQGPDTAQTFREWLAPKKLNRAAEDRASPNADQTVAEELHPAPRIQDLLKPDSAQADSQQDLDAAADAHRFVDPQEAMTTAIPEAASPDQNFAEELFRTPRIQDLFGPDATEATQFFVDPRQNAATSIAELRASAPRPSLTGRLLRVLAYGVLAIGLAAVVTLVLTEGLGQKDDKLVSALPVEQSAPSQDLSALQHQIDAMASDLAALQRVTEQISVRELKMTQDVASLQTSLQTLSQRVTALTQDMLWIQQSPSRRRHSSRR
jgi:hypothetical protein